jgi:hypothetical protein
MAFMSIPSGNWSPSGVFESVCVITMPPLSHAARSPFLCSNISMKT